MVMSVASNQKEKRRQTHLAETNFLLHIQRVSWIRPLVRMPPVGLPLVVFKAHPTGRTYGQNENMLERLYISSDLRTPQDTSGKAGECCLGEGYLEYLAEPAATAAGLWINCRKWRGVGRMSLRAQTELRSSL